MNPVKEDKQVFGESSLPADPREVFAGDENFYKSIEADSEPSDLFASLPVSSGGSAARVGGKLGIFKGVIIAAIVVIAILLAVPISVYCFKGIVSPSKQIVQVIQQVAPSPAKEEAGAVDKKEAKKQDSESENMAGAVSWKMAQNFYQQKNYAKAASAYGQLLRNISQGEPSIIRDFLNLRLGLCSQRMGDGAVADVYFNKALRSSSPAVVALTSYNIAYAQFSLKNYSEARTKAYQCLAIVETIERPYCEVLIADCYFLIAQALTAQVMMYETEGTNLPADWPAVKYVEPFEELDEAGLLKLLQAGSAPLRSAVLGPQVQKLETDDKLQRWFFKAYRCPIEEVYVKFASCGGNEMCWACEYGPAHGRSITLYLPAATANKFAEIATGAAGLLASFESKKVLIYNPVTYASVNEKKNLLANEALACWQRFAITYPTDKRVAEAHFGTGILNAATGQYVGAIGAFRQVANNYSQNPLAPYALYNSGKIQLGLKDYSSAKYDLKELTVQYAEAPISDQGNILLAQTTMALGDYEGAQTVFRKIFHLDVAPQTKLDAAMGAAKSYYAMGDLASAAKWFEQYINFAKESKLALPSELQNAYMLLAQSKAGMGKYDEACAEYKSALANSASPSVQFEITMDLVGAFIKQELFVEAMETLEKINLVDLTADQTCRLWVAKSKILRAMNLPDHGLMLLEGKLTATSDMNIKALMLLEMAYCCDATGDYARAKTMICDVIINMPSEKDNVVLRYDLARICLKLNENTQAVTVCNDILKNKLDAKMRERVLEVLGGAYTNLKQYDKAALVYSGITTAEGVKL